MTAKFITCEETIAMYRDDPMYNDPVNINHCISITKGQYKRYPDTVGLPSIRFKGCDVEWCYTLAKTRDEAFARISNNIFDNNY